MRIVFKGQSKLVKDVGNVHILPSIHDKSVADLSLDACRGPHPVYQLDKVQVPVVDTKVNRPAAPLPIPFIWHGQVQAAFLAISTVKLPLYTLLDKGRSWMLSTMRSEIVEGFIPTLAEDALHLHLGLVLIQVLVCNTIRHLSVWSRRRRRKTLEQEYHGEREATTHSETRRNRCRALAYPFNFCSWQFYDSQSQQ